MLNAPLNQSDTLKGNESTESIFFTAKMDKVFLKSSVVKVVYIVIHDTESLFIEAAVGSI